MKLIPLAEDSKVPEEGTTIKSTISDDPRLHQEWMRDKNIGFPLEENTVVVADFDGDKEKKISGMDLSREFYRVNKDICKVMVETRRGIHFYFSGTAKTRKIVIDGTRVGDIKGNGYVVFPPSVVDGWQYRFVQGFKDFTKLAPFPAHLFPHETKEHPKHDIRNIRDYLKKVEAVKSKGTGWAAGVMRAAHC
ncbi:MAG TPA: bifunctional DNA primase/polymerase, partial [Pirellulaceae bacterium]